jgi:hypothetical protein
VTSPSLTPSLVPLRRTTAWIALGSLILALCCLRCGAGEAPSEAQVRLHALALNGILDSLNGRTHTSLAYLYDTKAHDDESSTKSMLSESWGITSREGLLRMLEDFESGITGHRARYWNIRTAILRYQPEHYADVFDELKDAASVHIVLLHIDRPLGHGLPITAWDFGRYINLCRSGFNVGWLSLDEAWDRIIPAARLLQASYNSWDDFASDYVIGRNFWNAGSIPENEMIRALIKGLERPNGGLWASIPWDESLGDGPVLEDALATRLLKDYVPRNQNFPLPSRHISDEEQADVDRKTGLGPR